jgi:hypothetical protein
MNKQNAKKFNQGYKGYNFAYIDNEFICFQKEHEGYQFSLIKLIDKDFKDNSWKMMFEHGFTR